MNVAHPMSKQEIWHGLEIKLGFRELLWPTPIGQFSVVLGKLEGIQSEMTMHAKYPRKWSPWASEC